jgi:hypothetical protein
MAARPARLVASANGGAAAASCRMQFGRVFVRDVVVRLDVSWPRLTTATTTATSGSSLCGGAGARADTLQDSTPATGEQEMKGRSSLEICRLAALASAPAAPPKRSRSRCRSQRRRRTEEPVPIVWSGEPLSRPSHLASPLGRPRRGARARSATCTRRRTSSFH